MLHKKYVNRGFTLVELLSVIVVLAIILVIAVPKIMSVITDSKKSSLETSAKVIASSAEKVRMQNIVLGKENEPILCSDVAKLSENDYDVESCKITFDSNNNATVSINGKGKFSGFSVCGANKNSATTSEDKCPTDSSYFTYNLILDENTFVHEVEVIDMDKCVNAMESLDEYSSMIQTSQFEDLCKNGVWTKGAFNSVQQYAAHAIYYDDYAFLEDMGLKGTFKKIKSIEIDVEKCKNNLYNYSNFITSDEVELLCSEGKTDNDETIKDYIVKGYISSDFDEVGLNVILENPSIMIDNYNKDAGANVIIPSTIDGNNVVEISDVAFYNKGLTSVEIPNTVTSIGTFSFMDNNISNVKFPSNNITISDTTFYNNTNITYPSNINVQSTNNNFAKDSWATISTNDKSTYNVGERKPVSVGEYGNHIVRVSNKTECADEESQTACGFVVEFEDIITLHNMNSDKNKTGGYPETEMRTYLNNNLYNALSAELQNEIIDTKAISNYNGSNISSEDKIYLLSKPEIWSGITGDSSSETTRQLDYYSNLGVSTDSYRGATKYYNKRSYEWWLRGVSVKSYNYVNYYGHYIYSSKSNTIKGVAPAFRLAM